MKSLWCKFGLHLWIYEGEEAYTDPPAGPFDPRDEKRRTFKREMKICAKCGKREEYVYDPY